MISEELGMFIDKARRVPLIGPLVDCDGEDHWESLQQTSVILILSTMPIWLGTIIIFALGDAGSPVTLRSAFYSTVFEGEFFTYCTALLAPIFWIALVDPPRARKFPSKVSHMVLIAVINTVAAAFFGLGIARQRLNAQVSFRFSVVLFVFSLVLLYLGTVYHISRISDAPAEFKKQEQEFSEGYGEHRP
jgi:hypothetical protein